MKFSKSITNRNSINQTIEALNLETTSSSNQLIFNLDDKKVNINITKPSSNRTYIIPDIGADGNFLMGSGGSTSLSNNLIPSINNNYDIGSNALRWKNLYLAGVGYISTLNNGTNLIVPSLGSNLVTDTATQTLTNKTLSSATITGTMSGSGGISISGSVSTAGAFSGSSIALTGTSNQVVLRSGNTTTITAPAPASSITLTLPITTDTLVGRAVTETLSNKTLQFPTTGGTPASLDYYEELNTTFAFTGPFSQSMTVRLVRIGKLVMMAWQDFVNASTGAGLLTSSGAVPSRFRPYSNFGRSGNIGQNASSNIETIFIEVVAGTGTINIGLTVNKNNFSGTGNCGVWSGSLSWVSG